jgi:hypothetical protein
MFNIMEHAVTADVYGLNLGELSNQTDRICIKNINL